jgi:hypothetical protein
MHEYLMTFLKRMEFLAPPPDRCHHAITYSQYGSDTEGWKDMLALQVNIEGTFHCFFLRDDDLTIEPNELADKIGELLRVPMQNAQLGVGFGQYL